MRIHIRLDRTNNLIPAIGDEIRIAKGKHIGRWQVVDRTLEAPFGWDEVNGQLFIAAVELELEGVPG